MKGNETRALLQRTELFRDMAPAAVDAAYAAAIRREQPAGGVLFQQGQESSYLYVVIRGRLRMTRISPNGAQITVGILGSGELVGCAAVFSRIAYPATATAVDDTAVLGWTRVQVERLVKEHPVFAKNALHIVGQRSESMLTRVQELVHDRVEQRVARALLRLAAAGSPDLAQANRPEATRALPRTVSITRQELAELSGATLHTVSRIVARWDERGVVDAGRKRIAINHPDALAAIAESSSASS